MKKKLSILLFVVALAFGIFSFSTNSLALENEKSYEVGEIFSESDTLYDPDPTNAAIYKPNDKITPYDFGLYKDKTITVFYPTFSAVPESRYYEEYTNGYWFRGTLALKSVVASGSGYTATFYGILRGSLY